MTLEPAEKCWLESEFKGIRQGQNDFMEYQKETNKRLETLHDKHFRKDEEQDEKLTRTGERVRLWSALGGGIMGIVGAWIASRFDGKP